MKGAEVLNLLQPYPHEEMGAYAVSPLVNSPSNDGPRCVEPITDSPSDAPRLKLTYARTRG